MKKSPFRRLQTKLERRFRRWLRRQPRWLRQAVAPWLHPIMPPPRSDGLAPSPGVQAFMDGESMRQVAHFVGDADPGIVSPRDDWPGAVADAHGVVRDYLKRLQDMISKEQK